LVANRLVLLAFAMLPCLLVATGAWFAVPQFHTVLQNFGAPLPWPTALVLATYRWWALSALLPMALALGWPPTRDRAAAAVICGSVLAGLMAVIGAGAMYLAIFQLARIVG